MTNKVRAYLMTTMFLLCGMIAVPAAHAKTTLLLVKGGGEFQSLETSMTVTSQVPLTLQWTTDEPGLKAGMWRVTDAATNELLKSGYTGPAPLPGKIARFMIPAAAFLWPSTPSSPLKFTITVYPGSPDPAKPAAASSSVIVEQDAAGPAVKFGGNANFPSLEIMKYDEHVGIVSNTPVHFARGTVKLRVSNKSKKPTDAIRLNIKDDNQMLRQASPIIVPSLKPGDSQIVSIDLDAILPSVAQHPTEEKQYVAWKQQYDERCGVDLKAVMDVKDPAAQMLANDHQQTDVYLGSGSTKPWQEGRDLADTQICDGKNCVSLNKVARSIYKQIGCKVVGYSFFVGDSLTGPRGRFEAFGLARKPINPPTLDFTPTTKMQIASSSKVLTGITALKVMGSKIDTPAFSYFPTNWMLPQTTIVKNITSRQLVSQTSGIQQYYAGNNGQDFVSLQTFFTQPVPNPNAPRTCPGSSGVFKNSAIIPNPIVSNKAPCYTDTNFGVMRLVLPRFAGANTNDPQQLADKYVQQVQDNVFKPVGVTNVGCKPPTTGYNHALLYSWARPNANADFGDLTLSCGDWGWYVSVEDYAKVLVSLNSRDHKILSDAQFMDLENNPGSHPVGFDIVADNLGYRWLEKNGLDASRCDANGLNCATQTTSVSIFGGSNVRGGLPVGGVVGVLFINSDIAGQPKAGAWSVLSKAFQDAVSVKH